MGEFYQKEMECASREEMVAFQNERLVEQVKHFGKTYLTIARKWKKRV